MNFCIIIYKHTHTHTNATHVERLVMAIFQQKQHVHTYLHPKLIYIFVINQLNIIITIIIHTYIYDTETTCVLFT